MNIKIKKISKVHLEKLKSIQKEIEKLEDEEDIKTAERYLKNRDKMKMYTPEEVWKRLGI